MRCPIFSFLCLFLAVACVKQEEGFADIPDCYKDEVVILQLRDPSLPISPNRVLDLNCLKKTRASESRFTKLEDYIGRSYSNKTSILGDQENIFYPVIDLERLRADHPGYFVSSGLFKSEANSYGYTTDKEYEEKSSTTKKISSGFKLNLGFFSIGRKTVIERTFSTHVSESSKDAYGELSIEVKNMLYSVQTSSLTNKKIAAEYLDRDFTEQLYNLTIDELLSVYGPFVLIKYYTGGRASALYYGSEYRYSDAWARVEGLQSNMEASFIFNKTDSLGLSFGFSKNNSKYEKRDTLFKSVRMAVKTIGGNANTGVSFGAKDISDINIDLSGWLSSLDNLDNHAVIGIDDEGLHPISDFLLEENFRERIYGVHHNFIKTDHLQLPYIEIAQVEKNNSFMEFVLMPILNTRHGDKIALGLTPDLFPGLTPTTSFWTIISWIKGQKQTYYDLEINMDLDQKYTTRNFTSSNPKSYLVFTLENVNESTMRKFINEKSNMVYLYDPVQKFAFSFPNDDYTVDVYGIRDWVELVPIVKLNVLDLCNNYRVIGL